MVQVQMKVKDILYLDLWEKVCDCKGWNHWIINEGLIDEEEWVEFDKSIID